MTCRNYKSHRVAHSVISFIMRRATILSHPSKAPCRFARERGKVHRGVSRRNETSLWVPWRRECQLLKSYEQSSHSENGVWLSCQVPSCKQSYVGLEHQPLNHNDITLLLLLSHLASVINALTVVLLKVVMGLAVTAQKMDGFSVSPNQLCIKL